MSEPALRVASAPVSFGVDEVLADDAWMPEADEVVRWMAELDYVGTEMGPPGYLGSGPRVRELLTTHGLAMVGAFLPLHFSRDERIEDDHRWLRENLDRLREATPPGSTPFAVLCEGIDETIRLELTGRIDASPESQLPDDRWDALVRNLHATARLCRAEGFEPVIHPHAGTYLETASEIERLMDRIDPDVVGLCLDTGHFRYGGFDPVEAARRYARAIRHVHVKDARVAVVEAVAARGGGLGDAVRSGAFCPLGAGDARIDDVIETLRAIGYAGWLVVEQDQSLREDDTRESLVAGQRANREYLRRLGV